MNAWIKAFRLRTLPLALSCILCGNGMAYLSDKQHFSVVVFLLSLLTTLLLQILSNLANDYGDGVKGTDSLGRVGEQRMIEAGLISPDQMRRAIILFSLLSLLSGCTLLWFSFGSFVQKEFLIFLLMGLAAIAAAILYTVGKRAYGYYGLGDPFVFLFFGWIGVCGSAYLQSQSFHTVYALPAISIGLFSVGVLNLNNMRDILTDEIAGKYTIPVRLGMRAAKIYHLLLIVCGWGAAIGLLYYDLHFWTLLLICPLFIFHLVKVYKAERSQDFEPLLPMLAMSTFGWSLLFCLRFLF